MAFSHLASGLLWAALQLVVLSGEPGALEQTCAAAGGCDERLPRLSVRFQGYRAEEPKNIYGGAHLKTGIARQGFEETVLDNNWDLLWTHHSQGKEFDAQVRTLKPRPDGRKALANNCAYFKAAGQKCYFAGHVRRIVEALGKKDIRRQKRFTHLRNLVLNHKDQYELWQNEARNDPKKAWVYKICNAGMSQGVEILRGKDLLAKIKEPKPTNVWTVVQEYLANPYMGFGASKFHLRVYALVTQWDPSPRVFIYNEGVVFRSKHKYDAKKLDNKRDVFSAISADVEAFPHTSWWAHLDEFHAKNTSSPSAASVREHMLEVISDIFSEAMEESMGKSSVFGRMLEVRNYNCFDLFGLDVMFNDLLEPIVLEVNTGPNMEIDDRGEEASGLLKGVKAPLIAQLGHWMRLRVVNQEPLEAIDEAALMNFTRVA